VADTLSRPPEPAASPGPTPVSVAHSQGEEAVNSVAAALVKATPEIDWPAFQAAQASCPELKALQSSSSGLQLQHKTVDGVTLVCDVSGGRWRPLVPSAWREKIFSSLHSLAHPGIRASRRMISARFVWKGMAADVATFCRSCLACQRAKAGGQSAAPLQQIPIPVKRFSHIHVDLVGPLPVSAAGHKYILTAIDRTTRWMEAVPLVDISAAAIADSLVAGWISRFGLPDTITSDKGVQFTSSVWAALCGRHGIKKIFTTAYHPQSNGMVERLHRQLKEALRSRQAAADWPSHLPWVLLGLRAAAKEDSGLSSAELLYGVPLRLPAEPGVNVEATMQQVAAARSTLPSALPTRPKSYAEILAGPPLHLASADMVFVRTGAVRPPLSPLFQGPYTVVKKGPKVFIVQLGGREEAVSVDRLKAYHGVPVQPAAPPTRGRPSIPS